MLKAAIILLVVGLIAFAVYSFTAKPNYEQGFELEQSTLHAKVRSSEIYPKSVYTNSTLRIKMASAVKEEYLYVTVRWFRNDQEIHGWAEPELDPGRFEKGDRIHAEVNLLGPDALAEPVVTTPVYVLNTPPDIIEASADLKSAPSDVIHARVNAVDADGDKLKYRYKWFRNGAEIGGENKSTLDVTHCSLGDQVYAMITAFDGEDESPPFKSEPIKIGSDAPRITSTPPQTLTKDRRYVYRVTTSAPDPTLLTFDLVTAPPGMKIDNTGLIDWALPKAELGSRVFDVVIRVTDPTGGEAYQEFDIAVTGSPGEE
jgi:hypothetical protein